MVTSKEIEIGLIDPNPFVAREDVGDIDGLAASMNEHGQLDAIIVRPSAKKPGRYETADGDRRTRAAKKARWKTVTAQIVDLTDVDMIVRAAIPAVHRKQHTPVEEAAQYAALVDLGLTIQQIALQCTVPQGRVVKRLVLRQLVAQAKTALADGLIGIEVAELLAKTVALHQQADALAMVAGDNMRRPLPTERARELLVARYMRSLPQAPFDPDDEKLVEGAPRCAACPKRSGQQPLLFDVEDKDLCGDQKCFDAKTEATWRAQIARAKKDGRSVIDDPKRLKKVFPFAGSDTPAADYVSLDGWADTARGLRWREVLEGKDVMVSLALSPKGPVEIASREQCQPHLLAAQGREVEAAESAQKLTDRQVAAAAKRELDRQVAGRCMDMHVADIEANGLRVEHWRHLCRRLMAISPGAVEAIVKRRDCGRDGFAPTGALGTFIEQQPLKVLQGLAFELLDTTEVFYTANASKNAGLKTICSLADLDMEIVRDEVKAAAKAEQTKEAIKPKRGRRRAAA